MSENGTRNALVGLSADELVAHLMTHPDAAEGWEELFSRAGEADGLRLCAGQVLEAIANDQGVITHAGPAVWQACSLLRDAARGPDNPTPEQATRPKVDLAELNAHEIQGAVRSHLHQHQHEMSRDEIAICRQLVLHAHGTEVLYLALCRLLAAYRQHFWTWDAVPSGVAKVRDEAIEAMRQAGDVLPVLRRLWEQEERGRRKASA